MPLKDINDLKHETWVTDPLQMNQKVQAFWSPYWNRDSVQDLTDEQQWNESLNIIENSVQQQPEISIPVGNLEAWRDVIRKTKTKTAKGSCGFSKAELRSLSDKALQDLIDILSKFAE